MSKKEFWVTNVSKMNVSLADLALTIKSLTSVNLLDERHYYYTPEQLIKSATNGSLAAKKDKIVLRNKVPEIIKSQMSCAKETVIPSRERSVLKIEQENYEELNVTDEQFADENADTAEIDRQPVFTKEYKNVAPKTLK